MQLYRLVGRLNRLGSNNYLALSFLIIELQGALPLLVRGTHQFTHGYFDFATGFRCLPTISVHNLEFQILMPLKVIGHREAIAKVRIQRILYCFRLALLQPSFALFLVKYAFRVSFAECIKVAKFAAGDKDVDLHDI